MIIHLEFDWLHLYYIILDPKTFSANLILYLHNSCATSDTIFDLWKTVSIWYRNKHPIKMLWHLLNARSVTRQSTRVRWVESIGVSRLHMINTFNKPDLVCTVCFLICRTNDIVLTLLSIFVCSFYASWIIFQFINFFHFRLFLLD